MKQNHPKVLIADDEQAITDGLFREDDFLPLPCAHPNCHSLSYAYRSGGRVAEQADRDRGAAWWARRVALMLASGALLGVLTHRSTGLGAAANEAVATSTGPCSSCQQS